MKYNKWLGYVGRYLKFLTAFILLMVSINALFFAFTFLATSNDLRLPFQIAPEERQEIPEYDFWVDNLVSQTPLTRKVIVDINPKNVKVTLLLSVEGKEPLAQTLLSHPYNPPSDGFLLAAFGQFEIAAERGTEMEWNGPTWLLDQKTNQLNMSFDTVIPIDSSTLGTIRIYWEPSSNLPSALNINDELQITLLDSRLQFSNLVPAGIEKDKVVFKSEGQPLAWTAANIELLTEKTQTSALTRQGFINRLGNISVPFLSRLLFALVELLPLVALIAVGFGYISFKVRISEPLKRLTAWMLSIHFLLYFIMIHVDLYNRYLYDSFRFFAESNFRAYFSVDMWVFWANSIAKSYDLIAICLMGVLLPLVFLRDSQPNNHNAESHPQADLTETNRQSGGRLKFTAFLLFLKTDGWKKLLIFSLDILPFVGIASALFYFWLISQGSILMPGCADGFYEKIWDAQQVQMQLALGAELILTCALPRWVPLVLVISIAMLLVRSLVSVMAVSLWNKRIRMEVSWLGTLVIVFMIVYPSVFLRHPEWNSNQHWGWFFFSSVFGVILLYQFSMGLISRGLTMKMPLAGKWMAPIVFVIALALAIPSYYGGGNGVTLSYQDDVARLAFSLDNLLIYLWTGAILWLLYQDGKVDLSLKAGTRWVGLLAGASLLYNVTNRWFYIPAAFLLGWLALNRLTRKPQWAERTEKDIDLIFKQVINKRPEMLKRINLLSIAERTLGALQKKKREKVTTGEEDFEKARMAINVHITSTERLRKAPLMGVDDEFKNIPLAFGPYNTAWKNGTYGASWAFLLALPWLVIYLIGFMKGTDFSRSYGLNFVVEILSIATFWTGIGFFMGFFFPYLRGNTGLQKSVWLALAIILPTLPLHVIHYRTLESWQAFLLWAIQVLVECILLGLLAFDYGTIRRAGSNWESLLEIHGLLSLGVGISGVALALITAIGNLIADPTKALALWNSALQIVLPVISQADKIVK